ncbi:hypothetical protein B0T10DRAFT_596850 [Thelonectria olida]|uniref:Rhodopsin domain-containing protein n=1 Tax=Thelonectria olida TaxID=1576542 RepID=A0A9P8W6S0_9HYPO|nr:hypothetical protein B0T10DRAFT_596850 [Thelonectria olida]
MVESAGPIIAHSLWSLTVVSFILMVLRFACKRRHNKSFAVDDAVLSLAWVCLLVYTILTIISTMYGLGRHIKEIPPEDFKKAIQLLLAGEVFAISAIAISKTSFAITLLRLATKSWQRYLLWYIILSLNIAMGMCCVIQYVQCSPVEVLWDPTVKGKCWDPNVQIHYSIFAGSYSSAMDILMAIIPWVMMWKLQMKKREKAGLSLAMSLGVFAGIAAAIKTSYLPTIARSIDFTYTCDKLLIWAGCETSVTIMATSLPFFRLVLKEVSAKAKGRHARGYRLEEEESSNSNQRSRSGRTVIVQSNREQTDNSSDTCILHNTGKTSNTIMQTSHVTVEYHDADLESQAFNWVRNSFSSRTHSQG